MSERVLLWEGCLNVRDLGGLPTRSGGVTRSGAVVRADNVRRLAGAGWEAALQHGVRRIVDLRFAGEVPDEPPPHADVEVVEISLYGRQDPVLASAFDRAVQEAEDVASAFAEGYVEALRRNAPAFTEVLAAIAGAAEGAVVVHCFAGKDRTGLVSALLLAVAGVDDEAIAADYALSEPNVSRLFERWVSAASDEDELRLRTRLLQSPAEAMLGVLTWLREAWGSPEAYLADAGLGRHELRRLRERLGG